MIAGTKMIHKLVEIYALCIFLNVMAEMLLNGVILTLNWLGFFSVGRKKRMNERRMKKS